VAQDILDDWRAAWRTGVIDDRLAATLTVIEEVTSGDGGCLEEQVADALTRGVPRRALLTAGYVNFGFNVINRVADAVGVRLEQAHDVKSAATLLLVIGYRPLAGCLTGSASLDARASDPFARSVNLLRTTALCRPAAVRPEIRRALYDGTAAGPLGDFGRAVAERAWAITGDDVSALIRRGFTDDELFETTICSALGAATRRLDRLLAAVPDPGRKQYDG